MGKESAEMSHEEAMLERRLEQDGAAWRARVPANDQLNAWVRALPDEMPRATGLELNVSRYRPDKTTETMGIAPGRGRDDMKVRHPRSARGWAATAAAVLVVGVIALLLVSTRAFGHPGSAGGMAPPTPTEGVAPPTPSASAPAWAPTPAPIPSVASMVTAKGVNATGQPVDPTSQFTTNQPVYVIVQVRNAAAGPYTLTIRWYLNGTRVQLPSSETTSIRISAPNTNVYFTLSYPSAGRGTAKVYWGLPPNTPDAQADAWLAQSVAFDIA
jgi:hypothetical protein